MRRKDFSIWFKLKWTFKNWLNRKRIQKDDFIWWIHGLSKVRFYCVVLNIERKEASQEIKRRISQGLSKKEAIDEYYLEIEWDVNSRYGGGPVYGIREMTWWDKIIYKLKGKI